MTILLSICCSNPVVILLTGIPPPSRHNVWVGFTCHQLSVWALVGQSQSFISSLLPQWLVQGLAPKEDLSQLAFGISKPTGPECDSAWPNIALLEGSPGFLIRMEGETFSPFCYDEVHAVLHCESIHLARRKEAVWDEANILKDLVTSLGNWIKPILKPALWVFSDIKQ